MIEDPSFDNLEEALLRKRLGDAFRDGRHNQPMQSKLFIHRRIVVNREIS